MTEDVKRLAANCKYARPTLMQPTPQWLEAEEAPWTCVRASDPRALLDTEICEDCPNWQLRDDDPALGRATDTSPALGRKKTDEPS